MISGYDPINPNSINRPFEVELEDAFKFHDESLGDLSALSTATWESKPSYDYNDEVNKNLPTHIKSIDETSASFDPRGRAYLADWWLEILATILSVSALAAIFVVLVIYSSRPLASWPFSINLNTVISTCATVSKSSLLLAVAQCISQLKWAYFQNPTRRPGRLYDLQIFDDASRGPLGACYLLGCVHMGAKLASLGALLIIVALAMETFTQQAVLFIERTVEVKSGTATISRAEQYSPGPIAKDLTYERKHHSLVWNSEKTVSDINPTMEGAILSGLYGSSHPLEPVCSTNNYTFPNFTTLSVCSKCVNVTQSTTRNCTSIVGMWADTEKYCAFTTPSGFDIGVTNFYSGGTELEDKTLFNASTDIDPYFAADSSHHGIWNALVFYGAVRLPTSGAFDAAHVSECQLYFCEKTYGNITVRDGSTVERPVMVKKPLRAYSDISGGGAYELYNYTNTDNAYPIAPPYRVKYEYDQGLRKYLYLGGSLKALWLAGNDLEPLMSNVADNIEQVIRSAANGTTHAIAGKPLRTETYIHVRWEWLILPAAVVLFAVIFLLATIFGPYSTPDTRRWKSSGLMLLFTEVVGIGIGKHRMENVPLHSGENGAREPTAESFDRWGLEEVGDGGYIDYMERAARRMRVRLQNNRIGGRRWPTFIVADGQNQEA
ncbi:MAG: hypothetical protein M1834_006551 [Cirrosporium novae-zelandiae]|nr:MAG: hypothetical protein M1834_006551 [Cirrosporium novae-zelandiae]